VGDRRPVGQRHDGLEDELELVALERTLEVALRAEAIERPLAHALVEDLHAAAVAIEMRSPLRHAERDFFDCVRDLATDERAS